MGVHNICIRFDLLSLMLCHRCPHQSLKVVIRFQQHVLGAFVYRFYRQSLKEKWILVKFETKWLV